MITILVVEDDKNTRLLTEARLRKYYNIVSAENGEEALDIIYSKKIDFIISDIMMPKMDGFELLHTLKEDKIDIPILFLTAKNEFENKKKGYENGIDDYITKPINYDELILKIDAILRRCNILNVRELKVGNIILNIDNYTVKKQDETISFTKKEFELLYKLLSYPDKIFTKMQLLEEIWGYDSESMEDTIKIHISKIRKKLGDINDFEIVTVKGLGYKTIVRRDSKNEE